MSEGDPGIWAAVAGVISDRVRERGWRQRELAERSHVPAAVVRETQCNIVELRRSQRALEALPVAPGWAPHHHDAVTRGCAQRTPGGQAAPDGAIWSRLGSMERRFDEMAWLLTEIRSGIATVIHLVRDDLYTEPSTDPGSVSENRLGNRSERCPSISARMAEQVAGRCEAAAPVRIPPCR